MAAPDIPIEPCSTITCPQCGHAERETMPTNACQYFYDCKGCGAVLKPKVGDCCVYCSYGTVPCRPSSRDKVAMTSDHMAVKAGKALL